MSAYVISTLLLAAGSVVVLVSFVLAVTRQRDPMLRAVVCYGLVFALLACIVPPRISAIMGHPLPTTWERLPMPLRVLGQLPRDSEGKADLWGIHEGPEPVAYEFAITEKNRETLREIQQKLARNEPVVLDRKPKGKKGEGEGDGQNANRGKGKQKDGHSLTNYDDPDDPGIFINGDFGGPVKE